MRRNTRTKHLARALAVLLALGFGATLASAQGSGSKRSPARKRPAAEVTVTLTGSLSGAHTSSGSKSNGLVFTVFVARDHAGEELQAYEDWELRLVDGPVTRRLLQEHDDGEELIVRGRMNVIRKTLEVVSFSASREG